MTAFAGDRSAEDTAGLAKRHFLAKDYASFRAMMLGELQARLPTPATPHPAGIEVTLAEALAYVADYLSYHQDAVATEAYLPTARQRLSAARHARLLGYGVNEGCSARTFACFAAGTDGADVAAGTQLLPRIDGMTAVGVPARYATDDRVVFETLEPLRLWQAHNRIAFSSRPPLAGDVEARCHGVLDRLTVGAVLVLTHVDGWAHPLRLVAVETDGSETVIRWHEDDALPPTLPQAAGGRDVWVLLGNVALAQHGRRATLPLPDGGRETRLLCPELAFAVDYEAAVIRHASAAAALLQDPHVAEPMLTLSDVPVAVPQTEHRRAAWRGRRSLIEAGPFDRVIAVEPLDAEHVMLSFGDGQHGRRRRSDLRHVAHVRIGRGVRGNIGPRTLAHVVEGDPSILSVVNPLPATGGADPETLGSIRMAAPAANLRQDRLVTDADLVAAASALPGNRAALVRRERTATRVHLTVTVARADDRMLSAAAAGRMARALRPGVLLGQHLRVTGAAYVTPPVAVRIGLASGHHQQEVVAAVRTALASLRFGFGEVVHRDRLTAAARAVAGVRDADSTFASSTAASAVPPDAIVPPPDGIVRIDGDLIRIDSTSQWLAR